MLCNFLVEFLVGEQEGLQHRLFCAYLIELEALVRAYGHKLTVLVTRITLRQLFRAELGYKFNPAIVLLVYLDAILTRLRKEQSVINVLDVDNLLI